MKFLQRNPIILSLSHLPPVIYSFHFCLKLPFCFFVPVSVYFFLTLCLSIPVYATSLSIFLSFCLGLYTSFLLFLCYTGISLHLILREVIRCPYPSFRLYLSLDAFDFINNISLNTHTYSWRPRNWPANKMFLIYSNNPYIWNRFFVAFYSNIRVPPNAQATWIW